LSDDDAEETRKLTNNLELKLKAAERDAAQLEMIYLDLATLRWIDGS
jgi:hypothetical protein